MVAFATILLVCLIAVWTRVAPICVARLRHRTQLVFGIARGTLVVMFVMHQLSRGRLWARAIGLRSRGVHVYLEDSTNWAPKTQHFAS